jgi:hypothetical protein
MSMSYWEFRSEALTEVAKTVDAALAKQIDPYVALTRIEQITTETDLAFDDDGNQLNDDETRVRLAEHYGEPRQLSWDATS